MTETELLARGFRGGDRELEARYQELIGATPSFAPGLDPLWCRAVMFELVTAAAQPPAPRRRRRRVAHAAHAVRHRALF